MKKNRKRIVAAFMTVLMALTLVPTWLLGGVFATTAKADEKTYSYDVTKDSNWKKNTNIAKDTKIGTDGYFVIGNGGEKGDKAKYANSDTKSIELARGGVGTISFTVPAGMEATASFEVTASGAGIAYYDLIDASQKSVSQESGAAGCKLTDTNQAVTASYKLGEGTYTFRATAPTDAKKNVRVYKIEVNMKSAGPVVGAMPTVKPDSLTANYNQETGKVDLAWEASVEGSGDSVYQIYVGDKKVDSVKCTEKTYSYTPDKSGEYTFSVKGALGDKVEEKGASKTVAVTLPLSAPTVKATRVPTDGTKINVEASGSEAEKYEFSVYDSDKKLVKTVEAEAKDGKAATTVEGLKEGYKYYVSATAVRGEEKKESDAEKMASVMPYAEKDTSQAIPGMTVINTNDADNSKTVSLTIVRENGTIKAGQTSGKSSKIEKTGVKYGSLIAAPATTKDFTFSATIKVTGAERGTSTSKQQGVYLGAFADTKQGTKDIISAELGTDGKAYSAYIGIKKDGEFDRDGGVDAKLDTEYKVTITRTGSVYTYSVKNKNDDVVMQESVTATADALKEGGAAIPAIALVGATATITNIKLTVDGYKGSLFYRSKCYF